MKTKRKARFTEAPAVVLQHSPRLTDGQAEYMSVKTAATFLSLSDITIRRLLTQKRLTRFKAAGRTLVSAAEVRDLVKIK